MFNLKINFRNYIKSIVKEIILELQDVKEYTYESIPAPIKNPSGIKQQLTKYFKVCIKEQYVTIYITHIDSNLYKQKITIRENNINEFFDIFFKNKLPEKILEADFHIRGYSPEELEISEYVYYKNLTDKDIINIMKDTQKFLELRFPELFI